MINKGSDCIDTNNTYLKNYLTNTATENQKNLYDSLIKTELANNDITFNNTIIFILALIKKIFDKAKFENASSLNAVKCIFNFLGGNIDEQLKHMTIKKSEINNVLSSFDKTNKEFYDSVNTRTLESIVFFHVPKIIYTTMKNNGEFCNINLNDIDEDTVEYLNTEYSANSTFAEKSIFYNIIGCDPSLLLTKEFEWDSNTGDYNYIEDNSDKLFRFLDLYCKIRRYFS